jgi:hypothetical protein
MQDYSNHNVSQDQKEIARHTNLIRYLLNRHPDLIVEKSPGQYAYAKQTYITFYRGRNGIFYYCDHEKRKRGEPGYYNDAIQFLIDYLGIKYYEAVAELCSYADEETEAIRNIKIEYTPFGE